MEFIQYVSNKTGTTVTSLDFSKDIDRGVEFLDEVLGNQWLLDINPALLDVASMDRCVCGQAFEGHYREGAYRLGEWLAEKGLHPNPEALETCTCGCDSMISGLTEAQVARYGFNLDTEGAEWGRFKQYWLDEENAKRRSEALARALETGEYEAPRPLEYDEVADDAMAWTWSCLTEQWLHRASKLIADRGLRMEVRSEWDEVPLG